MLACAANDLTSSSSGNSKRADVYIRQKSAIGDITAWTGPHGGRQRLAPRLEAARFGHIQSRRRPRTMLLPSIEVITRDDPQRRRILPHPKPRSAFRPARNSTEPAPGPVTISGHQQCGIMKPRIGTIDDQPSSTRSSGAKRGIKLRTRPSGLDRPRTRPEPGKKKSSLQPGRCGNSYLRVHPSISQPRSAAPGGSRRPVPRQNEGFNLHTANAQTGDWLPVLMSHPPRGMAGNGAV